MNQLNGINVSPFYKHLRDRALELELKQAGWCCNRLKQQYKKNDIEFNDVNEAYDYEFNGVSDE